VCRQLREATLAAARAAVKAAEAAWGSRALGLLDAEDRLSVACEKGATADAVLLQLRSAYQVGGARAWLELGGCVRVWCLCVWSRVGLPGVLLAPAARVTHITRPATVTRITPASIVPRITHPRPQAMLDEYKAVTDQEKAEVVALGGLHVVGTGDSERVGWWSMRAHVRACV
jgi:hypothetical protein